MGFCKLIPFLIKVFRAGGLKVFSYQVRVRELTEVFKDSVFELLSRMTVVSRAKRPEAPKVLIRHHRRQFSLSHKVVECTYIPIDYIAQVYKLFIDTP